jgi:two-component sensor histidine kinase
VLQVAEEMVDNAVRHGMRLRLVGRIFVSLWAFPGYRVNLTVLDDGWGPGSAQPGNGYSIMAGLAGQFGGSVSLTQEGSWTVATMTIPDRFRPKA